jgi:tetratricopeptide (TPR) repeat protein
MLGEIEIAIEAYRIATELSPQDSTFWIVLAQASLNHEFHVATMGQPAARNAVALEPDNALAVDALAYSYYLLGDFDYADRLITKAIELDPFNPSIQYHLGLLRASQNQYQGTIAAFEMAVQLDPDGSIGEMARRALETISQ